MSSLINKDPKDPKSLLFRQIELNWINAPLDDANDYIGLYLDSQPDDNVLPVSVHRLHGQTSGQIISDYYLPQIDFYNETFAATNSLNQDWTDVSSHSSFRPYNLRPIQGRMLLNDECIGYCLAYHSRNKILARDCLKTNPTWMQTIFASISSRSLPNLMVPGSHNSGTYSKQLDKSVLQIINKYQLNQDESIFNQLLYGIRHLDLRIGYSKVKHRSEKFWIYHDIFRTENSADEVFDQIKRFLDLTSHEIVIMDIHRFTVGFQNENVSTQRERHARLIELIFSKLGSYVIPSYLGQHAPISEYVAMRKRLVVGYAGRSGLLGPAGDQTALMIANAQSLVKPPVHDIDYFKQIHEDLSPGSIPIDHEVSEPIRDSQIDKLDHRMGTRLYNRLKSLKLISKSFSKRSTVDYKASWLHGSSETTSGNGSLIRLMAGQPDEESRDESASSAEMSSISALVARVSLFFPPVRHLWPNKDSVEGLAQYMNDTACRRYFGELRSLMVELTPTVFGAISDKYDGNRRLAQLVNRQVTDWVRDRWLHCLNIVSSDYFLGNDLIKLSIYANKLRTVRSPDKEVNPNGRCRSLRRIEHLLDKSKIPIQFAYQQPVDPLKQLSSSTIGSRQSRDSDIITHTSSDGNRILLKPLMPSVHAHLAARDKRESFVDNISDGFTNLVSSFKRLLNL